MTWSAKWVKKPGASADPVGGKLVCVDRGTVTQATSITTGVTLNKLAGTITTVSQTIGGGAEAEFTVTNSTVKATDVIALSLKSTASAGGPFMLSVTAVADGSFKIAITNTHTTSAGDSTLVISYVVIGAE